MAGSSPRRRGSSHSFSPDFGGFTPRVLHFGSRPWKPPRRPPRLEPIPPGGRHPTRGKQHVGHPVFGLIAADGPHLLRHASLLARHGGDRAPRGLLNNVGRSLAPPQMKPISNFLNRTPWWALLGGGLGLFVALALFTTPFHLIKLDQAGATPEENRAIKREVDSAFSEGAIDLARSVVKEMRDHTRDAARREELERALAEIDD